MPPAAVSRTPLAAVELITAAVHMLPVVPVAGLVVVAHTKLVAPTVAHIVSAVLAVAHIALVAPAAVFDVARTKPAALTVFGVVQIMPAAAVVAHKQPVEPVTVAVD